MYASQRIVLARRPNGNVSLDDFRLEDLILPDLKDGDIALETLFITHCWVSVS